MKRFSIIAGIILAGVLLMRINSQQLTMHDIVSVMGVPEVEETKEDEWAKPPKEEPGQTETQKQLRFFEDVNFEQIMEDIEPDLSIVAFGDMMMGRFVRVLMERNGHDYVFENLDLLEADGKKPFYGEADLVFGNLEGPIKGQGYPSQTSMVFGFHEDTAPFLAKYGFDVLSIANNHSLDQKWEGRETTIEALEEAGIGWCGHPKEADLESVHYEKVNGKNVAFVCFEDAISKVDHQEAVDLVKNLAVNVDFLIVSVHWGAEYVHRPNKNQVDFAHELIDAGTDFIIGHHPHVVQSFEVYNNRFIFYSLGNFVFDQYWSTETQEQLALKIELESVEGKDAEDEVRTKVHFYPMKSEKSRPRLMTPEESEEWIERFLNYGDYNLWVRNAVRKGVLGI